MDISTILLHLSLSKGVGPGLVAKISNVIGIERLHELYHATVSDLIYQCQLTQLQAESVRDGLADRTLLQQETELLAKHQVSWIPYTDASYPALLKEIYLPPIGLYVRGSVAALHQPSIAIVGSREAGRYAYDVIAQLVPPLLEHALVIVSGGARGVDTMAHQETLAGNGVTIAVLGSGLLEQYPKSNKALFNSIVEKGGAVVSSFPLRMAADAPNFPARNRIIAGLARGTVVVQAAQKSGARITALCALEQGRDVFAVPGSIDDPLSVGCHELIREGAILVGSADHILDELGYIVQRASVPAKKVAVQPYQKIDDVQHELLAFCTQPISFDDLSEKSSYKEHELYDQLFQLQCDRLVEQLPSGLWQRK